MAISAEFAPRPSPLRTIIPIITILGLLAYSALALTRSEGRTSFLEIGAVVGFLVYIVTFVDIILGIAILILCVGLSPEVSVGGVSNLRLEDFIVPALLLAWLMNSAKQHRPFARTFVGGPAALYFFSMCISTLIGLSAGTIALPLPVFVLGKYLEYFVIFLIIANNVATEAEFKALVIFILLATIATSFVGAGEAYNERTASFERFSGPFGETANVYGGYLAIGLGLSFGLYLNAGTFQQRLFYGAVVIFLGIMFLYTYSRTSYASIALSMTIFGLFKDRRLLIIVLVMAALFPLMAPDSVYGRALTITTVVTAEGPSSWQSRVNAWQDGMDRLSTNPLFGFGVGSVNLGDVDNEYVRILLDSGIAGILLFAWLLTRWLLHANRLYNTMPPGTIFKGYAAGFCIVWWTIVFHSIGATSFTSIRTAESFFVLAGLMVALANRWPEWSGEQPAEEPDRVTKAVPV